TLVPAAGFSLMTLPTAMLALAACVTAPTVRPAPVIAVVAAAWLAPTTLGTATGGGPEETTRVTAEPFVTRVPAAGLSLMTFPAATLALDACVTAPAVSPAPAIALLAACCASPTTLGTATGAGVSSEP